jgi:two-component system response regulator AtoC
VVNKRVLIADDEKNMRWVLGQALTADGYEIIEAADGKSALEAITEQPPDLMILDHKMPAPDGMEVLRRIRSKNLMFPVIMLTAHGNVATAVEAMKAGATEYLTKPFDLEELKLSIDKALRIGDLAAEVVRLREELDQTMDIEGIVASDPAMLEILDQVKQVAPISAGALPETLLESELFGYEKGAFTGAVTAKPGRFEMANGGTLFLDEIGDITPAVQVKLLRVLQERAFERLGGTRSIEVDVRLVAATNQDLQQLIEEGQFREDLFYRLSVVPIQLPALRARPSDIPALVAHFMERFGAGEKQISPDAMKLLAEYQWPGNIRELENTIERVVILTRGDVIGPDDLPAEVRAGLHIMAGGRAAFALPDEGCDIEEVELDLVKQALNRTGGNVAKAAKLLGLTTKTLEARMAKFGL